MSADPEGMNLTPTETTALAIHLAARHIHGVDRWLDWGDVPNLGEFSFERLADAVQEVASDMYADAADSGIDLAALLERLSVPPRNASSGEGQ